MDELSQALSSAQDRPEVGKEAGEVRHGFMLGEHRLLLAAGTLAELAGKTAICALPDTPAWFAGFINHRGHTVPVYDLSLLIGAGATDLGRQYWILLLDRQPATFGVILRQLPAAINDPQPAASAIAAVLPEPLERCVSGRYQLGQQSWAELDHRGLVQQLKSLFHARDGVSTAPENQNNEQS
ncbi:chemotaxis protein CheW [Marinobacterium lutimaris]|uniref:Chemotaxis signal transduction protein n=1 Tax=Marinobacterium lutimaris TaxID=568106 RepID=A0A1H6D5X0_9GAMM|nr:chemotaxis protein CheW [Marinobacterium lutimaris]SEG80787.1 Chemotaxis signal transduction protein [Marinobacterium lutimaris]